MARETPSRSRGDATAVGRPPGGRVPRPLSRCDGGAAAVVVDSQGRGPLAGPRDGAAPASVRPAPEHRQQPLRERHPPALPGAAELALRGERGRRRPDGRPRRPHDHLQGERRRLRGVAAGCPSQA